MKPIISVLAVDLCLGVATSGFEERPWEKYAEKQKIIETWECTKSPYV